MHSDSLNFVAFGRFLLVQTNLILDGTCRY